jgi:hypothetical protein
VSIPRLDRANRAASCGQGSGCDMGWTVGGPFQAGAKRFYFIQNGQAGSGAHPASYSKDIMGFFLGVKRLGHEADHPPSSSA